MSSENLVPPPLPAARGPVPESADARPGEARARGAERLLVVSASMGSGHDTVADELVRRARAQGRRADAVDVLALLPYGLGAALRGFYRTAVREAPWIYAGIYDFFLRPGASPRPSGTPLARLASGRLLDVVRRARADVVVPVFHLAAQLTGHLRERGVLRVPSVVVVVDFAAHRQWLHPGNDLHLCVTDQVAAEVRRGTGRPAEATGPVVAPGFFTGGPGAGEWRRRIERHGGGRPAVLLSAGAWGAGAGLAATARLLAGNGFAPVVLCGRNERLRRALSGLPGVLTPGWVTDMPGLLHACDALVDNAAGQTAVQALAAGVPVVGYRPLPGHGAEGVGRMAALGVCEQASGEAALLRSLIRLTAPGEARERRVAAGRALFREDALTRIVGAGAG